ncbi:hypothetical protein J5J86_13850 [Aquabacter sp. L1I39]|nr:hypothetical protein [Aquabacter sp. L1I39]QTL01889.1 hypothetical protein J5J86_13850 [Aquabacter sp. L1I39]
MDMSEEDRAFITEAVETLNRLIREARRRRFTTLGYVLEMALMEARAKLR